MAAINRRALAAAHRVLETGCTLRACARELGVGKTTVHRDLKERLPGISPALAGRVALVLEKNRLERHVRGGAATREKYVSRMPPGENP